MYPTRGLAVVMLGWLPDELIASYGVSYEVPLGEEKGRKSSAALDEEQGRKSSAALEKLPFEART